MVYENMKTPVEVAKAIKEAGGDPSREDEVASLGDKLADMVLVEAEAKEKPVSFSFGLEDDPEDTKT